jgi:23S rRNA (cytidine1920-2'-O)/16S rRNA (cytidine1409-2'-O)-methyltransferase
MRRLPLIQLLKSRFPQKSEKELFAAVLRGEVSADGRQVLKAGEPMPLDAAIALKESSPYVSRGGEKLAHALMLWHYDVQGKVFLDAGSSTGGFADCLLKNGASRVYCVDVGYNVLDWRLRSDPRVCVRERTNVMNLSLADFSPSPHQAAVDLSFRSLRGAAARILGLTLEGVGIFLVKPQFEWRSAPTEFSGVVRETGRLRAILEELCEALAKEGVYALKAVESPIRGRKGNREFLFLFSNSMKAGGGAWEGIAKGLILE